MKLNRLSITDFGPYRGEVEFDLRTTPDSPVILFGGKNGAGKTTLFESVQLCLHGQSALGRRTSSSEYESKIRNSLHDGVEGKADSASVEVQFEYANMGERDTYTVERSWRDRGKSIVEDLTIERNGEELDDLDSDQWQDFLKELIPPGVSQLFFFDGEKVQELATAIEEDSGFGDSLLSLLGLDLVEQLEADLSLYLTNKLDQGGQSELQDELEEINESLESKKEELGEVEQKIDQTEIDISEIEQEVSQLEDKLAQEGGTFAQQREELKERKASLESEKESIEEQIREEIMGDLAFSLVPDLCRNVRDRLKEESEKQHAAAAREQVVNELGELATKHEELTAGTDLTDEQTVELVSRLQSELLDKAVEDEEDQYLASSFSERKRQRMYSAVERAVNEVPERMESLTSEFDSVIRELSNVEKQLSRAPEQEAIQPILDEINEKNEKKGEWKNELESLKEQHQDLEKEISRLESDRERKLDKESQFEDVSERAELAKRTRKAVQEYKQKLANQKLERLEEVLTERYRELSNKGDYYTQVHVDPQGLEMEIETNDGSIKEVSQLSAGERQIFATAMIWALADISDRPLPFIIDTPLGRLDQEHRGNLVKSFFPEASHQVLVLSTDTEITDEYYEFLSTETAAEYHLEYDEIEGRTRVSSGYFGAEGPRDTEQLGSEEQITMEGYNE